VKASTKLTYSHSFSALTFKYVDSSANESQERGAAVSVTGSLGLLSPLRLEIHKHCAAVSFYGGHGLFFRSEKNGTLGKLSRL